MREARGSALSAPASPAAGLGPQPGDWWGGLAAMLVALPSSIAYGLAIYSTLGPGHASQGVLSGLLGAAAIGTIAPLLGGTPRLVSAPCAPAAAVLSSLAATALAGSPEGAGTQNALAMLALAPVLAAVLQWLYGLFRGGRIIKYIPYPVVSGYMSGVGLLIAISQLPRLLGIPGHPAFADAFDLKLWDPRAIVIGLAAIGGMLAAPKISRRAPGPVAGLACGFLAFAAIGPFVPGTFSLEGNSLVIGRIEAGAGSVLPALAERWNALTALSPASLGALLWPALTLSVLLSIDTLKTCVVVDALTRSRHDSNRELLAQGIANLASASIGGMPGAGTMGATLVNVQSGARTRWSGAIEGAAALAAFLLLGRFIAWIPVPALAGILMVVAARMFDWKSFSLLGSRATALDFAVVGAVIVVAVTHNLIAAAGAGVALSVLLFVRDQIQISVVRRKVHGDRVGSKTQRLDEERAALARSGREITLCELQGNLFFGTADQLFTELEPDLPGCKVLILDLRRVQTLDFTALHALELMRARLEQRGGALALASVPARLKSSEHFRAILEGLGARLFDETDDALAWSEDRQLAELRLSAPRASTGPLPLEQIELLREFEADGTLALLRSCVAERAAKAGEEIFSVGKPGDELILIRDGAVRIELPLAGGTRHTLACFGPGNFFGEMAFLDRGQRSASAVALTDCSLFVISRARFDEVARPAPLLGVKLFARLARALSARLRYADAEIAALHEW